MEFLDKIILYMKTGSINDIVDILIMTILIYQLLMFVKDTSAERLIKGLLILVVTQWIANYYELNTISFLLRNVLSYGAIAVVVVFQPEMRRVLEQLGKGRVTRLLGSAQSDQTEVEFAISQMVTACESMSWSRTGALVVFERVERLGEIVKTGTKIDAEPSAELIKNIFYPKSPLHDGAMVLRGGRIYAAGCVLPLSKNLNLSRELGTRHRAAVGMSELSDAVLVVVSEETGSISVAIGGMLKRHLDPETLRKILMTELLPDTAEKKKRRGFPFARKGASK